MNREEMKQAARSAIADYAPELAVRIVENVIESDGMQRLFDRWERRRPRGLVAFVRRMRGQKRGLDDVERAELVRMIEKYR